MKSSGAIGLAALAGLGLLLLLSGESRAAQASSSGGDSAGKGKEAEPDAQPEPTPTPPDSWDDYQKTIIEAVTQSAFRGKNEELVAVAKMVPVMPPALRAYLLAASTKAPTLFEDLTGWVSAFNTKEAQDKAKRDRDRAKIESTLLDVAKGLQAIPVIGQVVGGLLALGVSVEKAVSDNYGLPARRGEDQLHPAVNNSGTFAGIDRADQYQTTTALRQAVQEDWLASQLPLVVGKVTFEFLPTLAEFQAAGHKLKLYPGDK
jgi:hypothetical protein